MSPSSLAHLGQRVPGGVPGARPRDDAVPLEGAQPRGQDAARQPRRPVQDVAEVAAAQVQVPDDDRRPALGEDLSGERDRAVLPVATHRPTIDPRSRPWGPSEARSIHRTSPVPHIGVRWSTPLRRSRHAPPPASTRRGRRPDGHPPVRLPRRVPTPLPAEVDGTSVRTWNEFAVASIVATTPPFPGPVGPLYLTYVHRAVYDAVRGPPHGRLRPGGGRRCGPRRPGALLPGPAGETLDERYAAALAASRTARRRHSVSPPGRPATGSSRTADDGLNGPRCPCRPPTGVWEPPEPPTTAAAASWLGTVDPFVLEAPSQLRPGGPPALTSERYAKDYEEVKRLGGLLRRLDHERTPEQTAVALFWADPPAVQSQRALRAYAMQEHDRTRWETARLFALVNTAERRRVDRLRGRQVPRTTSGGLSAPSRPRVPTATRPPRLTPGGTRWCRHRTSPNTRATTPARHRPRHDDRRPTRGAVVFTMTAVGAPPRRAPARRSSPRTS